MVHYNRNVPTTKFTSVGTHKVQGILKEDFYHFFSFDLQLLKKNTTFAVL